MHIFYCFYLNSYRTDAFLQNLCGSAKQVTVLDYSLLRALYRGKQVERNAHTLEQLNRYSQHPAELNYFTVPVWAPFPERTGKLLNLPLSILIALFFGLFFALKLLISPMKHVVFYNGHVLFAPLLAAVRLKRIPYTTDLGDLLYLVDNPNRWTHALEKTFLRHSESIICVSRPFKDYLIENLHLPSKRISILSAAIPGSFATHFSEAGNARMRDELRKTVGAEDQDTVLVYSGGIWKKHIPHVGIKDVQGVESLCEAFEQINESGLNAWLILLGYSKDASELDRFRQGKWQHRFVEFGAYEPEGKTHLMALGGADYLCLPSYPCDTYRLYDRFKTIEYLAAGKRIVAADTPINRHLLGESGLYYPEGSVTSMARAIIEDRKPPAPFIAESNRRVLEKYNWKRRTQDRLIKRVVFDGEMVESY